MPSQSASLSLELLCMLEISMVVRAWVGGLMLVVYACSHPTEPGFPSTAVALYPPAPYRLWWALTESCSRLTGNFDRVRWYVVPGGDRINVNGQLYDGEWFPQSNRIVLATPSIFRGGLVRHEILHALTRSGEHSLKYFIEDCGGVVTCTDQCAREAGAPSEPPASAEEIAASDLLTSIRVDPTEPLVPSDSGWVALTVTVANSRVYPVWARLIPVDLGASASATFGYFLECPYGCAGGSEYEFTFETRMGFFAGQARQLVFDRQLTAGDYAVRGFFNSDTTGPVMFRVVR